MNKKAIRFIQQQLNSRGLNAGAEDGILGQQTISALDRIDSVPETWSKKRKAVAFIQLLAQENQIETGVVDGYWGPQTEYAYGSLYQLLHEGNEPQLWRPEDLPNLNPNNWPEQSPQSEIVRIYGEPGQNQTKIDLPYPHRLSWKTSTVINRFSCHEKVHNSLERVLSRVLDNYGLEEIKQLRLDLWGGCLNVRKMRGGTKFSMHSWGIALDYDPTRNKLQWGRDRASFAKPEYDIWWRLWEEEGWVSLGRSRNFDWMHVQAAKL
jgi:hypothetical protein